MSEVTGASRTAPGQTTTPWITGEAAPLQETLEHLAVKIGTQPTWTGKGTRSLEEGVGAVEVEVGVKGGRKGQRERGEMRGRKGVVEMGVEVEIGGKEWRVVIVLR